MACNVEEVLKEVQDKLDKSKKGSEEYSQLLAVKNKLRILNAVLSTSDSEGTEAFQLELSKSTTIKNNAKDDSMRYSAVFKEIAKEFAKFTVKYSDKTLLQNIRESIDSIIPAEYNARTGEITITDKLPKTAALKTAINDGVYNEYMKDLPEIDVLSLPATTRKTMTDKFTSELEKIANAKLSKVKEIYSNIDKDHILVHEMVHAASYAFLKNTPNTPQAKKIKQRIEKLFEEAKKQAGYVNITTNSPYWTRDVYEFVAEAISNPEVIQLLDSMKTGRKDKLTSVLRVLVDALVSIISTVKSKDTIYQYTLDGLLAIMEMQNEITSERLDALLGKTGIENTVNLELKEGSEQDTTQLQPYYSKMQEALENLTKIPVTKDATLALEKITKGIMDVVAGRYDPKVNSIKIAIKPTLEAITDAVQTGVRSMYIKNVGLSVNKNIESVLANDEQFKKIEKMYPEIVKDTVSMVDDALKNKDHAVLHEYVHAAALKFMSTNPDHPAVQRIDKIYKIALSDRYKSVMQKHVPWRVTEEEYWRRDVNEFVAEALSNPSVIAGLSEIKLTIGGRLTTALKEFVDAILKMLGIKEKSTAYEYVMDSFMAIVEAQKELVKSENKDPVVTSMDTKTIRDLEAIMNKVSLKNIQEMLECKAKGH